MLENSLVLVGATICLIILFALIRSGRFIQSLIFSAITGNAALFIIAYMGAFTGVILAPNKFTVGVASVLGIPGVLGMLLLKLIFAA